jgi:hypothetical protein
MRRLGGGTQNVTRVRNIGQPFSTGSSYFLRRGTAVHVAF